MGTLTMGRVVVPARIENLNDVYLAKAGHLPAEQIRAIDVSDALVDTGATNLCLPRRMIEQLGLKPWSRRPVRTATGVQEVCIYDAVHIKVQGRDCIVDVSELPDDCPVLIGQVPLELMDWVVDPKGQRLIGNPAHGGKWMLELY